MHKEDQTIIPGDVVNFSRSILEKKYEQIAKLSVAVIVATAYDVIREYRDRGMSFEHIAEAYSENGVPIKVSTLKWAFGKASRSRQATHAPSARGTGEQKNAQASPATVAATVASPSAPPPAPVAQPRAPRPTPAPAQPESEPRRPFWMPEEVWAMKPKIDKILYTYPAPDREYPELADARFWTDRNGKKWDVRGEEKPSDEEDYKQFDMARIRHGIRWQTLMEKWGLAEVINGVLTPRYKLGNPSPLTVDLDEIIAKHLD